MRGGQLEGRENLAHGESRVERCGIRAAPAEETSWFRERSSGAFSSAGAGDAGPCPHRLRDGLLSRAPAGAHCPSFSGSSAYVRTDSFDWRAVRQFPHFCVARPEFFSIIAVTSKLWYNPAKLITANLSLSERLS